MSYYPTNHTGPSNLLKATSLSILLLAALVPRAARRTSSSGYELGPLPSLDAALGLVTLTPATLQ